MNKVNNNGIIEFIRKHGGLESERSKKDSMDELKNVLRPLSETDAIMIENAIKEYKEKNPSKTDGTIFDLYRSLIEELGEIGLTNEQVENAKKRNIFNTKEYIQPDDWSDESTKTGYGDLLTNEIIDHLSKFITLEETEHEDGSKTIIVNGKKLTYPRYGEFNLDEFVDKEGNASRDGITIKNENGEYINENYKTFVESTGSKQTDPEYLYELINEVANQFKKIGVKMPKEVGHKFLISNRQSSILLLQAFRTLTGIKGRFPIDKEDVRNCICFLDDECGYRYDPFKKERNISFIAR